MKFSRSAIFIACAFFAAAFPAIGRDTISSESPRRDETLEKGWRTIALETGEAAPAGVEHRAFDDSAWRVVDVPHNWDAYEGFHQTRHGNRHGTAWYRRVFAVDATERGRRVFLFFEGVGSYATIWVNGREVGRHAGGLTTFTLDVTDAVAFGGDNLLVVRADHPTSIRDLPWVCGGSELTTGFSEGPQPFGIFRPVHVVTTATVRVEPFGVHVWNDALPAAGAPETIHTSTEIKNYDGRAQAVALITRVRDLGGALVVEARDDIALAAGETREIPRDLRVAQPHLWSPDDPHLYTLESEIVSSTASNSGGDHALDRETTTFGIRTIHWPAADAKDGRFFVNGRPVFINGTCDYEHLLGNDFAFAPEQIRARAHMIEAAGFNAFRDAHHPHNLRFQQYWDRDGLLWWPQFGAHIWFDNDAFRANYKKLLRDWVKERRNSPSLVLWGLQNESVLPTDFARECADIIREMDPTASSQRKITTCNGGTGTDWDVPQNWSGTYGGDPQTYADDLRRQRLVGEYGAWRSLGSHSERRAEDWFPAAKSESGGIASPDESSRSRAALQNESQTLTEERMCALLETKVRLGESVRDEVAGHFQWIFTTHANPGRSFGEHGEQLFDGIRELDQIGPANNKGLFTIWGEPTDAFFMYRANYAPAATQPMVYIVSHTAPDRWTTPGRRNGIVIYSNCDEVELFNDLRTRSLGVRKRDDVGTHFTWDDVEIATNVLYAEGRVAGKTVATDCILLHYLPAAPEYAKHNAAEPDILAPAAHRAYLYRVNCGGPEYVDANGIHWAADREFAPGDAWGSTSWARAFANVPPLLGSQRKIHTPIEGTRDDALFQTFRYGRDRLRYVFSVPDGDYEVELFFAEPWYGFGAGELFKGWRLFDVAVNGETKIENLDLASEAGRAHALKKIIAARAKDGRLEISFPRVRAGEAVISAIAISAARAPTDFSPHVASLVENVTAPDASRAALFVHRTHLDDGDRIHGDNDATVFGLPGSLLEADWIQTPESARTFTESELLRFDITAPADVFIARDARLTTTPAWLADWDRTDMRIFTTQNASAGFEIFERRFDAGASVVLGPNSDSSSGTTVAGTNAESSMYFAIIKRVLPPAPPEIIRDLSLAGGTSAWRAIGHLRAGQRQYGDRATVLLSIPPALSDSDWIRTVNENASSVEASFTAGEPIEVNVALDARLAAPPPWMDGWIPTNLTLTTSDRVAPRFVLWKKRFAAGEIVSLGANGKLPDGSPAAMYSVIARQVRPSQTYAPVVRDGAHAEWIVTVGVGDRYGLNFRYRNTTGATVAATLEIIQADGTTLRTDPLQFPPTSGTDTWGILRTRTGSSVNAGTYHLRVTAAAAPDAPATLSFDSLEVE